jgi:hypothetical protein
MLTLEATTTDTPEVLANNPVRADLVTYLNDLEQGCGFLNREQVLIILGQWYHPLHYFPTFLARLISVTPSLASQTFISRILWQELGEGDPGCAHEKIYLDTIVDGEFASEVVTRAPRLNATRELVAGYETASQGYLSGLGFLYGTEVVDLPMVSTIGELMGRCTGKRDLPWVDIHVRQEPDHVKSSNEALQPSFTVGEQQQIIEHAEQMWRLWIDFFRSIKDEILADKQHPHRG